MRVIALLNVGVRELDSTELVIAALAGDRADFEFVALHRDDVEIVQIDCVPGVSDDRADVAREKILLFANAEDERAAAARTDDEVGNVAVDKRDSVGADDLAQRGANGIDETSL